MKMLFDTSALYKRYNLELGRDTVEALLAEASQVVLAAHCKTEIASAMCRDLHDAVVNRAEHKLRLAMVEDDFADFQVMPIDAQIEARSVAAMEIGRLRAMDALHIGTAQMAGVGLFVTADRRQSEVAEAVGLKTQCIAL